MQETTIVLTGQRGYLGGALLRSLAASRTAALACLDCDLLDLGRVSETIERIQTKDLTIVHLATVNRRDCRCEHDVQHNVRMLANLLHASRGFAQRSILLASSVDVYGANPSLPINEQSPRQGRDPYSRSKIACEDLLLREHACTAILRFPGIYGVAPREQSLLGTLLAKAGAEGSLTLNNSGKVLRDFVHLEDAVGLLRTWIAKPVSGVWNVASGQSIELGKLFELIRERTGSNFKLTMNPELTERDYDLCFDITRLRAAFPVNVPRDVTRMLDQYLFELGMAEAPRSPVSATLTTS